MDKILIRGLEVCARHGVHDYEKTKPQRFVFDADLSVDFYSAAKTDDLERTVNYSAVCKLIAAITNNNSFNLIERLAYECAFAVMEEFAQVENISLTVYKPEAPITHKFGTVGVTAGLTREKAYLSLGSSIGDKKAYLDRAIKLLDATRGIRVEKVSSYISTKPYGGVAENEFLNCAVKAEVFLSPEQLLDEVNRIEAECGRIRQKRWDDRTLDIDIIFYGGRIINGERLIIPHPEYHKLEFVLKPLAEIAPDFVCPVQKKRIRDLSN